MIDEQVRERVLTAADRLYYGRGIQSVGMDELRRASGVSLKRLYQLFPSMDHLIEAYEETAPSLFCGTVEPIARR